MKIARKLIPLMLIAGLLTGCGKLNQHIQHARPKNQSSPARHASAEHPAVKRNVARHHSSGARQQNFANAQRASQAVRSHANQPQLAGLPTVNLGSGIKGHEDHGAGQTYVSFKMGNWLVTVHGNDVNQKNDTAEKEAKSLVAYFQNHTLPIPHNHGQLTVNTMDNSVRLSWQEGRTVHSFHGYGHRVLQRAIALQ